MLDQLKRLSIVMLIGLCAAPLPALADTLLLKDGRTFSGRLVYSNNREVVFEVHKYGSRSQVAFPQAKVARITKSKVASTRPVVRKKAAYTGPTCVIIPIQGSFGLEIMAYPFDQSLSIAQAQKPTVIILEINSGGGSVAEFRQVLRSLTFRKGLYKNLRVVAYVHRATSSAALLAMACDEIVVAPDAIIGGGIIYACTPQGRPVNISAKMQSLHRSEFRSHTQKAGHNPLLAEGMMRTDLVLGLVKGQGGVKIVEGKGEKVLKPKGKILNLFARDAVACGLALGIADTALAANTLLQIKEWKRVGVGPVDRPLADWWRKLRSVTREHGALITETQKLLDQALAKDPRIFSYATVANSGKLTARSSVEWRERQRRVLIYLKKAEAKLDRLAVIRATYPQLIEFGVIRDPQAYITMKMRGIAAFRLAIVEP